MVSPSSVWTTFLALNLADYLAIVVTAIAAGKVYLGRPRRLVALYRRRYLHPLGVDRDAVRARVAVLARGVRLEAAEELSWLADVLHLPPAEALLFVSDDAALERYALAYESYAARIERGVLLGATRAPLVQREVELCHEVAELLREAQHRHRYPSASVVLEIAHRGAHLELHGHVGSPRRGPSVELVPSDLAVSYRRHRIVLAAGRTADPTGTLVEEVLPVTDATTLEGLEVLRSSPHYFDGTLPRLTGVRVERDLSSGRHAVHVALAETSYFALVVDHYPQSLRAGPDEPLRVVTGTTVNLFTLAAVLRTSCGHLVFIRKSERAGSYQSKYGPTISGNLEFWPRQGLTPDSSGSGVPDPLKALAREGREELGLTLRPEALTTIGVATITVPEEVHSNVLLTCASVDLDLDELRAAAQDADPVEGAWEVGASMLALRMPKTESELDTAIDWLVGSTELNAHATLAGLGALATFGNVPDVFARARRSAGRLGPVAPPPLLVGEHDLVERPLDHRTP